MEISFNAEQTLVVAILAFFAGRHLTERIGFLDRFRIPEAVTGGLLVAFAVTLLRKWGVAVSFTAGDLAMLTFFTTVGLSARIRDLGSGGTTLALTLMVCIVTLVAQNAVGLLCAWVIGAPLGAGIMAGSVALIGGHGTAAAWAPLFQGNVPAANAIGIASATFGLVAGGIVGGPLGRYLILKNSLKPAPVIEGNLTLSDEEERGGHIDVPQFFSSVLVIALSIILGDYLNFGLERLGLRLPQFVTALFTGILIGNTGPMILSRVAWPTHSPAMRLIAELALSIFLVRALMSLELWTLASVAGTLLAVLMIQVLSVGALAWFLLFPLMRRSYDGAIICAGFVGLSLGATPTAVANMSSLTHRFGPSPTAFVIIPLVGAFFIDLVNAFVISALFRIVG